MMKILFIALAISLMFKGAIGFGILILLGTWLLTD